MSGKPRYATVNGRLRFRLAPFPAVICEQAAGTMKIVQNGL
jgi:hypothetical protein